LTILQLKNTDRYDTAVAPSFMMKQVSHTRLLGLGYRGNPRSSTPNLLGAIHAPGILPHATHALQNVKTRY